MIDVLKRVLSSLYQLSVLRVGMRNNNEEKERLLHVAGILLLWTNVMLLILFSSVLYNSLSMRGNYHGVSVFYFGTTCILGLIFYIAAKRGILLLPSLGIISIFYTGATLGAIRWGPDLPMVILAYVLVILIAYILLQPKHAFLVSFIVVLTLMTIWHEEVVTHHIQVDTSWKFRLFEEDIYELILIYCIISLICLHGSTQIRKSLSRARNSEHALRVERDSLEIKVHERTQPLAKIQAERMGAQYRFMEFGRLSSGIFHDISSPLTALALTIERLKVSTASESGHIQKEIELIRKTSDRLGTFVHAVKNSFKTQDVKSTFCVNKVIKDVCDILSHRLKSANIKIVLRSKRTMQIYGNPFRIQQAVMNIIGNSIDALESHDITNEKRLVIHIHKTSKLYNIEFVDNGCGMTEETKSRMFEAFFTTKPVDKGTGIGLSQIKQIIEEEFCGKISVRSTIGKGTTFIISFKTS